MPVSLQKVSGSSLGPVPSLSQASPGSLLGLVWASPGLLGFSWASAKHPPSLFWASDGPLISTKPFQASSRLLLGLSWASCGPLQGISQASPTGPPLGLLWASPWPLQSISQASPAGPLLGLPWASPKLLMKLSWASPGPLPHSPKPLLGSAGPSLVSLSLSPSPGQQKPGNV